MRRCAPFCDLLGASASFLALYSKFTIKWYRHRTQGDTLAGRLAQGGASISEGRTQCARKGIDPGPDRLAATRWEVADGYWPRSAGDPHSVRQGGVSRDLCCEARGLHLRSARLPQEGKEGHRNTEGRDRSREQALQRAGEIAAQELIGYEP